MAGEPQNKAIVAAKITFGKWLKGGVTSAFFRDGRINFTEQVDWSGNDRNDLLLIGLKMLDVYLGAHLRVMQITGVEVTQEREVMVEGAKYIFESHLDAITPSTIIDHKTSARLWTQRRADDDLQPTCYLWNVPGEQYVFTYYVITKTRDPQVQSLSTVRSPERLRELENEIIPRVVRGINSGSFPCTKDTWRCGYCHYSPICKEAR